MLKPLTMDTDNGGTMQKVDVQARSIRDLARIVEPGRLSQLVDGSAAAVRDALSGRGIVNVSSTAQGGGVAEMLHVLLPYTRGVDIDASWFVIDGDPEFFEITKRIHHRLHGRPGDGGPLGPEQAAHLAEIALANAEELAANVVAGDVVLLHDPQPAALAPLMANWGVPLVWRCHIGTENGTEYSAEVWEFLRPFLEPYIDAYVFTRQAYVPDWVPKERLHVIHPAIDPLAPKNREISTADAKDVLRYVGIIDGAPGNPVSFTRSDGTPGRVLHYADMIRSGPPPAPGQPLITQISRWDPLKDFSGVMHGFVEYVMDGNEAHLVLAGPVVTSVADDPEAAQVLDAVRDEWMNLPHAARSRVQLVCLPMSDADENGIIVNALQRYADVVVQKSLAEGFGLTVAEAMFKGKAVVGSRVGGIQDQITDGVNGLLVEATDLAAFGGAVSRLLEDPQLSRDMGQRAAETVIEQFLPDSSLSDWSDVVLAALAARGLVRA